MFAKLSAVTAAAALGVAVAAHSSGSAGHERLYTVRPGDTLWAIAASNYAGDPRAAIDRLKRRNGLASPSLRPGQRLVLP